MKFKGLFGAVVALGAMAVMSVCAQAAVTYSAGVVTPTKGEADNKFTVPVVATSDTTTDTVSGYIVELTYDPSVATPVVAGTDETGADSYVTTAISDDNGIVVSGIKSTANEEGKETLVVAWASATTVTLKEATATTLSDVSFTIAENADANATTAIAVNVVAAAASSDELTTNDSKSDTGSITIASGEVVIYGDVNGDNTVTAYDASLASQYALSLITLDADQIKRADVNGDDAVTAYDASLISQYALSIINKFPVEN